MGKYAAVAAILNDGSTSLSKEDQRCYVRKETDISK